MGLEERENKRRKSVVSALIGESATPVKEVPEKKRNVRKKEIVAPIKKETKNKRVCLLLLPSVHAKAQEKCDKLGVSLNECINQLLDNWVQ